MSEFSDGTPPVRVGIIGLSASGGFAAGAHVPALRALDGYELRGCSASSPESAAAAAAKHDVPLAFGSAELLAASDAIDLVVVTVKTPHHYELVMTALQAGKAVLCEWPLGNGSAQSAELAAEAHRRGLRTAVGLQARAAAPVLFLRDLVADGYVGEVLSTTIIGSGVTYGAHVPPGRPLQPRPGQRRHHAKHPNGTHPRRRLPSAGGVHRLHLDPDHPAPRRSRLGDRGGTAHVGAGPDRGQRPVENGAVASVHYRGGLSKATNLHWEINGTEGDLVVTGSSGHLQLADVQIRGARAADAGLSELEVPEKYDRAPETAGPSARIRNVANAYAQLLDDIQTGFRWSRRSSTPPAATRCLMTSRPRGAGSGRGGVPHTRADRHSGGPLCLGAMMFGRIGEPDHGRSIEVNFTEPDTVASPGRRRLASAAASRGSRRLESDPVGIRQPGRVLRRTAVLGSAGSRLTQSPPLSPGGPGV